MNMNPPPRRVPTPSLSSLKRKETTDHFRPSPVLTKSLKPPPPRNGSGSARASKTSFPLPHPGSAQTTRPYFNPAQSAQAVNKPNNIILAGYMAQEFLTKGTIFGEKIEPAKNPSRVNEPSGKAQERYVEVCRLLKTDGSHIAGIVNPTQLARYLNR